MFNDPIVAKETREYRKPAFTTYKGLKISGSIEQGAIRLSNLVGLKMAKRKYVYVNEWMAAESRNGILKKFPNLEKMPLS